MFEKINPFRRSKPERFGIKENSDFLDDLKDLGARKQPGADTQTNRLNKKLETNRIIGLDNPSFEKNMTEEEKYEDDIRERFLGLSERYNVLANLVKAKELDLQDLRSRFS